MKLYTRTGDDGTTALFGGQRVAKDALRVEVYGAVDELNAGLGLAITAAANPAHKGLVETLARVQSDLFDLGAHLATPDDTREEVRARLPVFEQATITGLERAIDEATQPVEELRAFILPGGCETAARLHHARTVCRRAERLAVQLADAEPIHPLAVTYLNRLSDLLFALARLANHNESHPETTWQPRRTEG
ncbi:cob(I)yrinic acid a,c-diamide adenosyltransferase [Mucisphaera calidilacus]|uniref:Corrinoid adenosyltransferase n=1 Tax=Mucisphaera calidilacus TaxID=2527982 RepID=A0A518BXL7_9BACT|nr:cob(I)yrinic acid a,c-diamide adenosyltransferase [Mucisphaera calidilacus]QDU71719.1 Cob(I)yrinic acid a,c-diamide adenosyltransferase [Mucisphaera calidilacus]